MTRKPTADDIHKNGFALPGFGRLISPEDFDIPEPSEDDLEWRKKIGSESDVGLSVQLAYSAGLGEVQQVRSILNNEKRNFLGLKKKPDLDFLGGLNMKFVATADGPESVCIVKMLLEHGAKLHGDDDAALRKAAEKGNAPLGAYLLAHGAKFEAKEHEALRDAASNGHLGVIRVLEFFGEKLDVMQHSAFKYAARYGRENVVRYILNHDLKPGQDHIDDAFCYAVSNRKFKTADLLLEHGADATRNPCVGLIAQHTRAGDAQTVKYLLAAGAQPPENAMDIAKLEGHDDLVAILAEWKKYSAVIESAPERGGWEKLDDNTVVHVQKSSELANMTLKTVFNFEARQVTTIHEPHIARDASASAAIHVQNFDELSSEDTLATAHAKLRELGGAPGDLPVIKGRTVAKVKPV